MSNKTVLVCSTHQDKQLVWSWEHHDWVCPVCGGRNCVSRQTPRAVDDWQDVENNGQVDLPTATNANR